MDYGAPCGHVLTVTTGSEQVSTAPILATSASRRARKRSPTSRRSGQSRDPPCRCTITGSATNFVQGETQVSFGDPNFAVGEITVDSPTSLTVPVAITTSATTGFKTVTVYNLGQVASQQYSFTVEPGVATLNEAIPNQAEQGAPCTSTCPLVVTPHRPVLALQHLEHGHLRRGHHGRQSSRYVSSTEVDANITIDPLSYVGGRTVTVTTPGVSCAESACATISRAFTRLHAGRSATAPAARSSPPTSSRIIPGPAIITSVSPNTGNEGQEVVFNITGSGTHWAQNFTQFYIAGGGSDLTINSVVINSATSATVDMTISPTANPGARSIYMVTKQYLT